MPETRVREPLPIEIRAEVINDLDEDIREKFLREFETSEIAEIVNHLDSDDAVDILNELPVKEREEVIAGIDNAEKEANILDLLRYDEDVAGGLMAKELIKEARRAGVVVRFRPGLLRLRYARSDS